MWRDPYMGIMVGEKTALIIVDVQRDFCLGGVLPVPDGDSVVPVTNEYIRFFRRAKAPVFVTRDWHPPDHVSFNTHGGPWPPHCVQNTLGAEFHRELKLPKDAVVVSKGMRRDSMGYSGFEGTDLERELRMRGVQTLFVGGLATDYCVKSTALDALSRGFEVVLLIDAVKGIDPRGSREAVEEALRRGARTATLSELMNAQTQGVGS